MIAGTAGPFVLAAALMAIRVGIAPALFVTLIATTLIVTVSGVRDLFRPDAVGDPDDADVAGIADE